MISLGPLTLALERLFAVLGIIAFLIAAGWINRHRSSKNECKHDDRGESTGEKAIWRVLLIGLIGARLGFVLRNWPAFAAEPLTALYIWQGGFAPFIGLGCAAITLFLSFRHSRALLPMAIAFVSSAAAALIATALLTASVQKPLPQGLVLQSLSGEASPLDHYRGQPFVINLWATWCPPCRREMPMMVEEAAASAVPILLINQGEGAQQVQVWLQGQKLTTPHILLDQQQQAMSAIGTAGLPTTLFIDSKGMIRTLHIGEISRAALLAGIRGLD